MMETVHIHLAGIQFAIANKYPKTIFLSALKNKTFGEILQQQLLLFISFPNNPTVAEKRNTTDLHSRSSNS